MVANNQQEARAAWTSDYPFELRGGGLGISLSCTSSSGSSSRTALVGAGNTLVVTNTGPVTAFLALGDSSVAATLNHYPVLAGTKETLSIAGGETITHAAGITENGAASLLVHRGYGN